MPPSSPPVPTAPLPPGLAPFFSAHLGGPDCHAPSPSQSIPPSSLLLRIAPPPHFPSFSVLHYHSSRCCQRTPDACPPRRADSSELFSSGATAASPTFEPPAPVFFALPTPPSIPALSKYPTCRCAPPAVQLRVAPSYLLPPPSRCPATSPQESVLLLSCKRNQNICHGFLSRNRRTAATTQKKKGNKQKKKRNMVTPRETPLKAKKRPARERHQTKGGQPTETTASQARRQPQRERKQKDKDKTRQAPKPCEEEPASPRAKHNLKSGAPRPPPNSVHLCSRAAWNPTAPPPPKTPNCSGKRRSLVGSEKVTDHGHAPKKTQNTGRCE